MVHQCYWRPDIFFFGDRSINQPATNPVQIEVATGTVNADNSVAYGEYLTAARCLEPDS